MAGKSNISRVAMKAMGIFGGVQMAGIVCSIVRTKLVALWIGPVGVGLFGLFNQALDTINTAANLGTRQSSVRDISQAVERGDTRLIAKIVAVVRRWSLWLGLGGATLTMALAPVLSRCTFGDERHVWGFVALAAAVLLMTVANGEYAVFQGLARLKRLASATLWGTVAGLVISIPLFYYLREKSIVPSIVAYAAGCAFFALVMRDRRHPAPSITPRETVALGKGFVKLGIFMTLGNFVTMLAAYVFNAWLNTHAGTHEVGLYQAGYTLVYKYTGLVLTALGMEYYPRLARVASSKMRLRAFVSQEINIAMIVMAPIATLFILLRGPVVWLLYAPEFSPIVTFASWIMIGTIFRAVSWSIAFVTLAKGAGKVYLATESIDAVTGLVLNIVFYRQWGLTGLGLSFVVWYVLYTILVWVVYRRVFHLTLTGKCLYNVVWALVASLAVLLAMEHGLVAVAAGLTAATVATGVFMAKKALRL